MRESIIETLTVADWVSVGNISGAVGSTTITGSGFDTTFANIATAQVLMFTDDAGRFQTYAVSSKTNDTTLELLTPLKTVVGGKAGFTQNYQSSPWVLQPDPRLDTLRPDRLLIWGSANHNLYGGTNFNGSGSGTYELFRLFDANEGILLKSLYMNLPFQYTMGIAGLTVEMRYVTTDGFSTGIAALGTNGRFQLSLENQEIPVNQFVPCPLQADTGLDTSQGWGLGIAIIDSEQAPNTSNIAFNANSRMGASYPSISRVLSPDSASQDHEDLDNTFMPIKLGARVVHINPLQAASVDPVST